MYAIPFLCFWTKWMSKWGWIHCFSALPLNLFSFTCFCLFGEDPCYPLPSSAPFHSYPSIHLIKSIKTTAYLAPTRILQRSGLTPWPKIVFPIFSTKTQKIKIKLSYLFTSLKSVPIISHLSPLKTFAEIDPERALSCPRRASYEAERGLM